MGLPQIQHGEAWGTQNVVVEGGLYLNKDVILQAMQMPGSARTLINFEPSLEGGYHRILGYTKFDDDEVTGTGGVLGVIVNQFDSSIIAMRTGATYRSVGSGWTKISGADTHANAGRVSYAKYSWATDRITFVDGDPAAYPVRIENSGSYTVLTNAPTGQKHITEFSRYLWLTSGDGNLTFSAPGDDNNYNAVDGAGQINVGFPILGLGVWRGALYVFGVSNISYISGTSAEDWVVTPLTQDLGMVGEYSLQEINGDLIYLSSDGFRTVSGTNKITDRELGVISRPINSIIVDKLPDNLVSLVIRNKSQYRIFRSTNTTDAATSAGILGALKEESSGNTAWEWAQLQGIKVCSADSGLVGGSEAVIHGGWDGYVYQQESGTDFSGTDIPYIYKTPYLVFNDPNIRKILYKLNTNIRSTGDITVSIGTSIDYLETNIIQPQDIVISMSGVSVYFDTADTVLFDSGTDVIFDILPDAKSNINLVGSCKSASFSFSGVGGADFTIQAFTIQFAEGARR